MGKVNIKEIQKEAQLLLTRANLSFEQKTLNEIIKQTAQIMIEKKLDPGAIPMWEGPAGLADYLSGKQNLRHLVDYGCLDDPKLWVLFILQEIENKTTHHLSYDQVSKKSLYSEPAKLTSKTIRAFLQAYSDYWYMREKIADEGLALLGFTKESLMPTQEDLDTTQKHLESIADAMYLPGILQSQDGWAQKGAVDAYAHATSKSGYKTNFQGAGLDEKSWQAISSRPWGILLHAALMRPFFESDETAFNRALSDALSGYMLGYPTQEYLLLKDEHYPDRLKEDNPEGSDFYQQDHERAKELREKIVAASAQLA